MKVKDIRSKIDLFSLFLIKKKNPYTSLSVVPAVVRKDLQDDRKVVGTTATQRSVRLLLLFRNIRFCKSEVDIFTGSIITIPEVSGTYFLSLYNLYIVI